jgi:MarR family transcriptional regulator, multiple antibiotic resistance protein MarR
MSKLYAVASTSASGTGGAGDAASPSDLASFFDDLVRCETRIYNAVGDKLRAEHRIATSQFEVLRFVRDHPECRVADLASAFAIGIGAASKGVDRLEANGWVGRLPNPADRRSSLITLTTAGATLVAQAEQTFHGHLAELITTAIGAEKVSEVGAALATLRQALEDARIGLPAG